MESSSLGPCSLSHLQQHLRFEIFLFNLNNTRLWDLPSVSGQEFPLSASSSPEGVLSVPKWDTVSKLSKGRRKMSEEKEYFIV